MIVYIVVDCEEGCADVLGVYADKAEAENDWPAYSIIERTVKLKVESYVPDPW